jgi:single-stranded DNA-binding protein
MTELLGDSLHLKTQPTQPAVFSAPRILCGGSAPPWDTLVCTFPLADRARLRPREEEQEAQAQWYRVELWARQAEVLGPLLGKGKEVVVHGQLELVRFERADGSEGFQPTVRRAAVELVSKREGSSAFPAA